MDQSAYDNATLRAWRHLPLLGRTALIVAFIAALVALWSVTSAAIQSWRVAAPPSQSALDEGAGVQSYDASLQRAVAMIDGRTAFVRPRRPLQPRTPIRNNLPVTTGTPSRYGGPRIIAMVGDSVWFEDGRQLRVGEAADDLEVISVQAPWSAELRWRRGDFVSKLFDRDESVIPLLPDEESAPDPDPIQQADTTATDTDADTQQIDESARQTSDDPDLGDAMSVSTQDED